MTDFRIDKITNRDGSAGTQICGVSTFSGTSGMQLPVGPTEYRGGRGRGVFMGGVTPSVVNTMDYIEIATTGNAVDFGDLGAVKRQSGGMASSTRGLSTGGGPSPEITNRIDYVTMSSQGGASDFGEITSEYMGGATLSNDILGYRCGGADGGVSVSTIVGMRIAQTGSFYDFGDMTTTGTYMSGLSSPTRGIIAGGYFPVPAADAQNVIQYITIQSTGNAQEFGDYSGASIGRLGTSASDSHGGLS